MITLILRSCGQDRFEAYHADVLITRSRQPLTDGARALIAAGHDPAELVTTRHEQSAFDSFLPIRLGAAAKWTYQESDRGGIYRRKWQPFDKSRVLAGAS